MSQANFNPFQGTELARVVVSTDAQREIWLADRLSPEASLAFNEAVSFCFRGKLDVGALQRALHSLVARHDALRSTLSRDGMSLLVATEGALPLETIDLTAQPLAEQTAELNALRRRVVEQAFDLERGPLVRAALVSCAADDHTLVLSAHHIVCDGYSFGVIAADLAALYSASLEGGAVPTAPDSFAEYAAQRALEQSSAEYAAEERYWVGQFAGGAPALDLPTDRARAPHRSFASERYDHPFDAGLVDALRKLGAVRGASVSATLLGGFAALLARVAGAYDVVIGTPLAGQAVEGFSQLVGHCVNLLPVRLSFAPQSSAAQLLGIARERLLEAAENPRFTLGALLQRLTLPRDPSRSPLVSVLFNVDQAIDPARTRFTGLEFEFASIARRYENFELFVNAVPHRGGMRLECQYNRDLFDRATVARWMRAFETLLRAAVERPETPIASLAVNGAEDLEELSSLQPRRRPFPATRLAHQWFEAQVARQPDKPAVTFRGRTLSYAELDERANWIAARLRALGVRSGNLVGLHVPRDLEMLAALLGVLKAGGGYVALDPRYPRERLEFMASDASLAALVSARSAAPLTFDAARCLYLDDLSGADLAPTSGVRSAAAEEGACGGPAYAIYTSGSTGRPKGVVVPHRTVANFLAAMQEAPGFTGDDCILAITTLSFDIHVFELLLPLAVGGRIVLASSEDVRDGQALARLADSCGATVMQATPASWRMLVENGWRGHAGIKVVSGGEPLAADLARALLARSSQVWNGYGPTETTVYSTFWRVAESEGEIFIGKPVGNTSIWVLDEGGELCPIGVPGEIFIGGDGVAVGYIGQPELTAERFVPDPYAATTDARMYRTGDRGRWRNNGLLQHLGRLDFQVKVRGYRIELGEIENVLLRHASVRRAVVLRREDVPGDVRLVAYVVLDPDAGVDTEGLRQHTRTLLPDYMVPMNVVVLAQIPLLPNGKVDRAALPQPDASSVSRSRERIAPRSETENRVAALMESVLALPGISVDDDFFALGGHSLLASQLTARINAEFQTDLPLRTLFEHPTVERLANLVEAAAIDARRARRTPIRPRGDQRSAPATVSQQRLWFVEQLHPGRVTYNSPSAHRLRGPLQPEALDQAFQRLIRRQATLRTHFRAESQALIQIVDEQLTYPLLPAVDLGSLPPAECEKALNTQLDQCTDHLFDLTRGPLFHARLFRIAPDEHVLFFMPHHIIWDGWSFDLFYEELAELYAAILESRPSKLPELTVSFGDYAAWTHEWMQSEAFATQLSDWRQRLENAEPVAELPTDRPRGAGMSGRGATAWLAVDLPLTDRLRDRSRQMDVTLFMTTLAAYCVLVHSVAGGRAVRLGTPVRGRSSTDVERVMGFFVNLLPVHISVDRSVPFSTLVRTVRERVLESFNFPDVPFEKISEVVRQSGRASAALYQALFSYQDTRQRPHRWGNLQHEQIHLFQKGATEDFGLWLLEHAEGLAGGVTYNADLFTNETAQMMRQRFLSIVGRVAENPGVSVGTLAAPSAQELEWLIAHARQNQSWSQALIDAVAALPRAVGSAGSLAALVKGPQGELVAPAGLGDIVVGAASDIEGARTAAELEARTRSWQALGPGRFTASGTLELAGGAAPAAAAPAGSARHADPQTATERQLGAIWQELLGLPKIGLGDNFFELGGHSLMAMQVIERMQKLTGKTVAPRRFMFESLGELSKRYDEAPIESVAKPGLMRRLFGRGGTT